MFIKFEVILVLLGFEFKSNLDCPLSLDLILPDKPVKLLHTFFNLKGERG